MQIQMNMPDLATNESPIRIVRWLADVGQTVRRGQPLVEVETDKATMEVECIVAGVFQRALCQVDDEVSVGQAIALIEVEDSAAPPLGAVVPPPSSSADVGARAAAVPSSHDVSEPVPSRPPRGPGLFARNRAAAAAVPTHRPNIPLSLAQRTAGRRLQESKQSIPHFYLETSFDASAIVERRRLAGGKLAWDAFFVLAAAKALVRFERFCCRCDGAQLVRADTDAIGVAIDLENELYVVPVSGPAEKTVEQISAEIRQARERLVAGDQELRRIRPALMTITNLGMHHVERFIPVINPPEASILGIGSASLRPVALDDGRLVAQHRCVMTLSVDHRVASGRYAAAFLEAIVSALENPA